MCVCVCQWTQGEFLLYVCGKLLTYFDCMCEMLMLLFHTLVPHMDMTIGVSVRLC